MNAIRSLWLWVNVGSGNGLVPSGNKPLLEPMLTKFHDARDTNYINPRHAEIISGTIKKKICLHFISALSTEMAQVVEIIPHGTFWFKHLKGLTLLQLAGFSQQDNTTKINSLGPSDAIWHWRSLSTLVQVMVCCLTAPSHYLNQCWLIISKVLRHSSEDIIIRRSEETNQ